MAAAAEPIGRYGAFSYPQYRRYWISMLARVFGLQFRFIGIFWLVERELELSPIWLGVAGISAAIPTIVLSIPAGVIADRYDHQRILLTSQTLTAILSFVLSFAILAGSINIWGVIAWQVATGALAALANPTQAAILPRLIDMRVMPSAVALQSSIWNSMRIVGPALAGVMLALIGTGQAFLVTAVGFALSAVLVATLRPTPQPEASTSEGNAMFEGVRFILGHQLFFATIGLSFFTSLFGASYQTLLARFANRILDVGAAGFGAMEAAAGIGGLLGTLAIIRIGGSQRAGPVMVGAAAIFGVFIALFAASRSLPLSMALLFAGSFFASMYLNLGMTIIQMRVPNELRGRVMGVWSMTWFLSAVGGLPAGAMAEFIGAPWAVAIGALSVTGFAVIVFLMSSELRGLRTTRSAAEGAAAGGD
jgi:MFS family permease